MLVTEIAGTGADAKVVPAAPTAVDLGNFGDRSWMKAVVVDYANHFRWLKNASWHKDAKQKAEAGEAVTFLDPDSSEMADWSGNAELLKSPENESAVNALVEYLVAEAGHAGETPDAALVEKGRAIAVDGTWGNALDGTSCKSCHDTIGDEFTPVADADVQSTYPTLAKYASQAWLKDFIRHPDAKRHYGEKNRMPAYAESQLSEHELNLLVRWMTATTKLLRSKITPASSINLICSSGIPARETLDVQPRKHPTIHRRVFFY